MDPVDLSAKPLDRFDLILSRTLQRHWQAGIETKAAPADFQSATRRCETE